MMKWADARRRLRVRANADQPDQAANAVAFGAQGIGLCRTEHMFLGDESAEGRARIGAMREMNPRRPPRRNASGRWPSCCRSSARTSPASFASWASGTLTIRTLDPAAARVPAPRYRGQAEVARQVGASVETIAAKVGRPAREQPDARPARLPAGNHLPGDHPYAGARPFWRPPASSKGEGWTCTRRS